MRDAFLEVLTGRAVDQVVWTADVDYWMPGQRAAGSADPAWDTEEGYVRFVRSLGCMPYSITGTASSGWLNQSTMAWRW